ncbi:MAG: lipoprotein-releasing system transmembrane subunit LolC [Porticoccaceae bacterium]|nr:MAG: lipoprotein-releasing system transmembrane subunit LolC [Porticoccaceae bacterium]
MKANLPLFIGLRYIRSKRSNGFVSFVSFLSFIAMALGVMALIVVLSVMNGFDHEIKKRILNVVPHATVSNESGVQDWKQLGKALHSIAGIDGYAPFVEGYGLLSSSALSQGVLIQGIDPKEEVNISPINQHMVAGNIEYLESGSYGIVLGNLLARSLSVIVGDSVILSLPELNVTPAGIFPRFKRFTVRGVFEVGAQVDNGLAFVHYRDAQKLYRLGDKVNGVKLRVTDPFNVQEIVPRIEQRIKEPLRVKTWTEEMSSLFQAIKMEKKVVGVLLAAIVAVAAFNIIASLVLMVGDKRRDIAVLRTLGAKASTISAIFMVQGSAIGLLGVMTGVVVGCLLAISIGDIVSWLEQSVGFHVFDPNVYFISQLPSQLLWQDVLVVSCLGIVLSILATIYPALRAGQVLPAEALRYDH